MTPLNQELATVAAALSHSTVQVQCRFGGGSGVIWQADGVIITNSHVVRGDRDRRTTVQLADGRVFDAVCTNRDAQRDLAVLKINATDLPVASIGNSDALRVGQLVLAVGNPLGVAGALTTGIIHAVTPNNRSQSWVQADIRLAPGNSGGSLADAQGRVIGINTVIAGGLALAIPSNTVERFLQRGAARPYLGVTLQPVAIGRRSRRVLGLLVLAVQAGSLAESAGLSTGDVLIGIAGQKFNSHFDFTQALQLNPGLLQLNLIRAGNYMTCEIQIPGTSGAVAA